MHTQANDAADGNVAPSIARFADDAEARLATLHEHLEAGTWTAGTLARVDVVIAGKARTLHVPSVEDRIVARVILSVATSFVDPELGPASYAYRPGLGVMQAVQAVVALREEGLGWVLRADVDDCFPSIPRDLAWRRLVPDERLVATALRLAERVTWDSGGARIPAGLAQGCPLSPLLANLVLVDLDQALEQHGFPVVRYGDDLAVLARTRDDAWEAARVAAAAVEELGMEMGADKTCVMSFEEGFSFLGEDFGPRYPPVLEGARVVEPDRKPLYVAREGGRVRVAQGRVVVDGKTDERLMDVPITEVGRIVLFGNVGMSAGARTWALTNQVDVVMASRAGNYLGTMLSHEDRYRPARLRAQLALQGTEHGLEVARAIVEAKVRKQKVLLQRAVRRESADDTQSSIGMLSELLAMLPQAKSLQEVMGVEGAAAATYFPRLGALLPEGLRFTLRTRQPPADVANAALSFLYTVLLGECVTALHGVGLDPCIGILHADQGDRPSLALDLMEEFRPLIVDQVIMAAASRKQLLPTHGRPEHHGVWLTKAGKEAVLRAYELRMLEPTSALPEFSGTLRRHLYRQAQRLRSAIMSPNEPWTGLSWR